MRSVSCWRSEFGRALVDERSVTAAATPTVRERRTVGAVVGGKRGTCRATCRHLVVVAVVVVVVVVVFWGGGD